MKTLAASIVICTYNRPILLEATLRSLLDLDFDPGQYEIIVVDNAGSDQSRDVFDSISKNGSCPMRYTREEQLGLSHARNKGVSTARGSIVAFLDDDELVEPNWLGELIRPYAGDDRIGCVGGKIIPVFPENACPSWYSKEIQGFFGGVDQGEEIHEVEFPREYIGGGNMSFVRQLIVDSGMFNVRLGIIGEASYSGEENEIALRIRSKGFKIIYNPLAVTYHRIESERISKQFFYKRLFQSGRSEIMYNPVNHQSPIFLLLKNSNVLLKSLASYFVCAARSEASAMKAALAVYRTLGKISGCLKLMVSK